MKDRIHLRYLAQLRDARGLDAEYMGLDEVDGRTAGDWYAELARRHAFPLPSQVVRPAINGRVVSWDHVPVADDELAFIPPMAGG